MNIGDPILAQGEITQVCEGFCVIRFQRVGTQAVTHVRVPVEALHPIPIPAPVVAEPKPRKVAVAH